MMEKHKSLGECAEWAVGCDVFKSTSDAAGVAALISALAKVERTYGADPVVSRRNISNLALKRLVTLLENLDVKDYVGGEETKS